MKMQITFKYTTKGVLDFEKVERFYQYTIDESAVSLNTDCEGWNWQAHETANEMGYNYVPRECPIIFEVVGKTKHVQTTNGNVKDVITPNELHINVYENFISYAMENRKDQIQGSEIEVKYL